MSTCAVVAPHCLAPAGLRVSGLGYARLPGTRLPRCYQCGEAVCSACSTRVGRSRICLSCQSDNVTIAFGS